MNFGSHLKIYLCSGSTDLRKSINGLSILVEEEMEGEVFSGHLFGFCNRKRSLVKFLYWERNGFCLWMKRLEKDQFNWPSCEQKVAHLTPQQMQWLLDGLDYRKIKGYEALNYTKIR